MASTIRDVAKRAGTSAAAVSAVFNGHGRHNIRVGAATRARILATAAELEFAPNPIARSLATRRTGVLGLVFPYSGAFIDHNPFCDRVLSGVLEEAVRQGYNLMLHTAAGREAEAIEPSSLTDPRVDGLILVVPDIGSPVIEHCLRAEFPYVGLVTGPGRDATCAVNADDFAGGRLATEHLIRLGHRRIAHLVGDANIGSSEPRCKGYLAAVEAAGIAPDPQLVVPAGFSVPDGYAAMTRLLAQPHSPTAVFATSDLCAEGALRALRDQGLLVPEGVAVVGYDDTWFAAATQPPLTSIHMPIYDMAALAVRKLIARVEPGETPVGESVLPVTLTIRQSCGAAASGSGAEEQP